MDLLGCVQHLRSQFESPCFLDFFFLFFFFCIFQCADCSEDLFIVCPAFKIVLFILGGWGIDLRSTKMINLEGILCDIDLTK